MNPIDMMKTMQKQLGGLETRIAQITVTGAAGGGAVEVDMSGKMEVKAVRIDENAVKDESGAVDIDMLQSLIVAACYAAHEKVEYSIKDNAITEDLLAGLMRGNLA